MKLKLIFIIVVLFTVTVFTIIIIKPFGGDKEIVGKEIIKPFGGDKEIVGKEIIKPVGGDKEIVGKEIIKPVGGDMEITKKEAIKIANKEVIKLGYDVKSMDVWISKYNTPWNAYLPKDSKSEYHIERQNKLKGKKYWAVNHTPKPSTGIVLGGNVCIFVDANNGEIITSIRGK